METNKTMLSNKAVIDFAKENSKTFNKLYNTVETCSLESFPENVERLSSLALKIVNENRIYANYYHIMNKVVSDTLPQKVTMCLTGIEGIELGEERITKIYNNFFEDWYGDGSLEDCIENFEDFVNLIK